jgi:hypothetical protein
MFKRNSASFIIFLLAVQQAGRGLVPPLGAATDNSRGGILLALSSTREGASINDYLCWSLEPA